MLWLGDQFRREAKVAVGDEAGNLLPRSDIGGAPAYAITGVKVDKGKDSSLDD
jgi:hypothetical protein